ncbi:folylpolyglutamate synthase/dihydrofolate synthase family protein [Fructilactobacillus vespulae]|uniref:bifunctional folylpolyglutamate synthase/dihydrofolate synthase n=1 Tax=Fructilactobacillus vespulae TaxID=1249630 RepID=UPI0039B6DCCA
MINGYQAALNYIHSRPRIKKETTQKRIQFLLEKLDNPQRQVKSIHVVGTNGKGSVVAYLQKLLQGSGQKVGTYTSPFMINFNERISIDGLPISDDDLVNLVKKVKPIVTSIEQENPEMGPSEFELITAMMYLYFEKEKVDLAIVEAGIGGKMDSTNVDDNSIMTIITTIGMDHMKLLGNTVSEIARDKAGIIRADQPTIVGNITGDALTVIKTEIKQKSSPAFLFNRDFYYEKLNKNHFNFNNNQFSIKRIETKMLGDFEMEDASIAIQAYLVLNGTGTTCDATQVIKDNIVKTSWIGRMEKVTENPLIIIDGAHNVPAVKRLLASLSDYQDFKINLVLAAFADKQYQQMLKLFEQVPNIDIYLTRFSVENQRAGADFNQIKQQRENYFSDWKTAIVAAQKNTKNNHELVLITGSLLFISEVRKYLLKY